MNSVFYQRYLRISVLDRQYLSMIFLDFNYFSFNSSAIFSKLSRSSSNFFFRVYTSFSFWATLVRSTANFFSVSTSWAFKDQTSGFLALASMLRIYSRTFFSSFKFIASCVFSANYFYSRRLFSCRALVSFDKSSVCWRRVVRISLQLSSLARRAFTYDSALRNCYWIYRDSPPPKALALSRTSSFVCCTFPNFSITSLIRLFISSRSSPKVNSYSSPSQGGACSFLATWSFTKAKTASLLSAVISAISWTLAAISVKSLRQSSISLGERKETSTERFRAASYSSFGLVMAYFSRLNIQLLQSNTGNKRQIDRLIMVIDDDILTSCQKQQSEHQFYSEQQ